MDESVALSVRHQSAYEGNVKKTWKNELEMDGESYNGGSLFNHLSAAANAGGDENTTVQDRLDDYNSMMDTLSSGDKDSQDEMMQKIKGNYFQYLKRLEGSVGTKFHKESIGKLAKNGRYKELSNALGSESSMPLMFATQYGHLFDKGNREDQEFLRLARYFHKSKKAMDTKVARYLK